MNNRRNGLSLFPYFGERTSYFLWIIMFSLSDIFIAYYDCRANKRNTLGALEFELHYERECIDIWNEISSRNYQLRPSTAFIVRDPVQREIFASHFRDRVVHHLIARRLTPLLERVLIPDVYSSRHGKGTHYGIDRVDHFMRSCSENYSRDAYVLKLDISGFFMSIDREILWKKIEVLIRKYISPDELEMLLYLIRTILFTDVRERVIIA
jgi:RNA-directed DNA polymerase